jgi:hypothetical protein
VTASEERLVLPRADAGCVSAFAVRIFSAEASARACGLRVARRVDRPLGNNSTNFHTRRAQNFTSMDKTFIATKITPLPYSGDRHAQEELFVVLW